MEKKVLTSPVVVVEYPFLKLLVDRLSERYTSKTAYLDTK